MNCSGFQMGRRVKNLNSIIDSARAFHQCITRRSTPIHNVPFLNTWIMGRCRFAVLSLRGSRRSNQGNTCKVRHLIKGSKRHRLSQDSNNPAPWSANSISHRPILVIFNTTFYLQRFEFKTLVCISRDRHRRHWASCLNRSVNNRRYNNSRWISNINNNSPRFPLPHSYRNLTLAHTVPIDPL